MKLIKITKCRNKNEYKILIKIKYKEPFLWWNDVFPRTPSNWELENQKNEQVDIK